MIMPCEIIGVGSSGLRIIEKFRALLLTVFQDYVPESIVKCIILETHQGELEDFQLERDEGNISKVDISIGAREGISTPGNLEDILKRRMGELEWFKAIGGWDSLNERRAVNIEGAGAIRPSGEFSLLMHWQKVETEVDWILNAQIIQNAEEKIKEYAQERSLPIEEQYVNSNLRKKIYVVGTLCGGTNSGIFLDLAYLIREKQNLGFDENICGIFLLPYRGYAGPLHNANVYGACRELEWVSEQGYISRWGNGRIRSFPQTLPYSPVYLISSQSQEEELKDTYDKAALRLFLGVMGMEDDLGGIQVSGSGHIEKKKYLWTFDIAGVAYPKYELVEAAACSAGEELCERMLRAENLPNAYEDGRKDLRNRVQQEVFQHCLNDLRYGDRTLNSHILVGEDSLATRFLRGIIPKESVKSEFERCEQIIRSDDRNITDRLVESLQSDVKSAFQRTGSMIHARAHLQGILNEIENLNKFWNETRDIANYNSTLEQIKPEGLISRSKRTREKCQELADTCIIRALEGGTIPLSPTTIWSQVQTDLREQLKIDGRLQNIEAASTWLNERRVSITGYLKPRDLETIRKVDRNGNRIETDEQINDEITRFKRNVRMNLENAWELTGKQNLASDIKGRFFNQIFRSDMFRSDTHIAESATDRIVDLIEPFAREAQNDRELIKPGVQFMSDLQDQAGFANYLIGDNQVTGNVNIQFNDPRNGRKEYPFLDDLFVCYVEKANFNFDDLAIWEQIEEAFRNSQTKATHLTFPVNDERTLQKYLDDLEIKFNREKEPPDPRPIKDILDDENFQKNMRVFVEGFCCVLRPPLGGGELDIADIKNELLMHSDWLKVKYKGNEGVSFSVIPAGHSIKEFHLADEASFDSLFSEENLTEDELGEKHPYLKEVTSKLQEGTQTLGGGDELIKQFSGEPSDPDSVERAENIQSYLHEKYRMTINQVSDEIFGGNGFLVQLDKVVEFWRKEEAYYETR